MCYNLREMSIVLILMKIHLNNLLVIQYQIRLHFYILSYLYLANELKYIFYNKDILVNFVLKGVMCLHYMLA